VILFRNKVLAGAIPYIKGRFWCVRSGPKTNNWHPYKRKVEAEVGVIELQSKECQGFLAATRS
jgi:hypothetical protein